LFFSFDIPFDLPGERCSVESLGGALHDKFLPIKQCGEVKIL